MTVMVAPTPIESVVDFDDLHAPADRRRLVVNRATNHDDNVVISFNDATGNRDAIGLGPDEARKLGMALIVAASVVGGGLIVP